MQMKDKLYKNNHKGIYYKAKKVGLVSLIAVSGFIAVSVPTYINYTKGKEVLAQKVEPERKMDSFRTKELVLESEIQTIRCNIDLTKISI